MQGRPPGCRKPAALQRGGAGQTCPRRQAACAEQTEQSIQLGRWCLPPAWVRGPQEQRLRFPRTGVLSPSVWHRSPQHKGHPQPGRQTWALSQSWLGPLRALASDCGLPVCHMTDSVLSPGPFSIQGFGTRDKTTKYVSSITARRNVFRTSRGCCRCICLVRRLASTPHDLIRISCPLHRPAELLRLCPVASTLKATKHITM